MAKRTNIKNLIGLKYGRLLILEEGDVHITSGGYKHRTVNVVCDCGSKKQIQLSSVLNGNVVSCGCSSAEKASNRMKKINTTHGCTGTPEYQSWLSMRKRCLNPNHKSYKSYGGRGIRVSKRWVDSFDVFINDMGLRPSIKHSIDRIDNNKGYNKNNCKWSTHKEQQRNKRNNVMFTYKNETKCIADWAQEIGISWKKFNYRANIAKWSMEKIINTK